MSLSPKALLIGVAVATLSLAGCASSAYADHHSEKTEKAVMKAPETIVSVAAGTEDLSTLVAAVKAADLVGTLNSDGPFTVFAPPNSAFDKLPDGTVATLLKPENKGMLAGILAYHVVGAEVMAGDLTKAIKDNGGSYTIPTVNGATLTASIVDGSVILTDAKGDQSTIIATDIDASNGVVHLIDTVVMPG